MSVLQTIGLEQLAQAISDPGSGGTIDVGDKSLAVCCVDPAGAENRTLADATTPGQILIVCNIDSTNTATVTDSAAAAAITVGPEETALCIYTAQASFPWVGVLLKGTAT